MPAPLPDLVLYSRPGCHLCDESRSLVTAWIAQRATSGQPVPRLVDRDITTDQAWEDAYHDTIPVLEAGERRLELAIRQRDVLAFLAVMDGAEADA